jgi:hypothetical protein
MEPAMFDQLNPKELLASGLVSSEPLFKTVLKDCHRLLDEIAAERAEKRQLREV